MKITPHEGSYYRIKGGKPYLIGSICRYCGYVAFPKKRICPICLKKDSMEETALSRKGKIDTFSVLHVAAPGFEVPYVVAYTILPEGPKVFSMIDDGEPTEQSLKIGQEVELVLGKIRDDEQGNEVVSYKFRPINPK